MTKRQPKPEWMTQEFLKSRVHYCPETGIFTRVKSDSPRTPVGSIAGCANPRGYLMFLVGAKRFAAHRLAHFYMTGEWPDVIDHINGNKGDNRWENLRNVPRQFNQQNILQPKASNKLGVLGVWRAGGQRYYTAICVDGKKVPLGSYETAEEAHRVYVEAKRRLHPGCTI